MRKILVSLLGLLIFAACQHPQPEAVPQTSRSGGLRKINNPDAPMAERLRQSGVKILVQQPDYLIIYSDSSTILPMNTQTATEKDLVQRLARIHFTGKAQLQQIVDLGVDVWEVEGDSVTARVYDLYLEQCQQAGINYRILKMDANAPEGK